MPSCSTRACAAGEAAALKVRDLDYKAGVIHVRETVTRDRSGHFAEGPCKTKNSVRDIPMTEPVKDILERAKAKRALLAFSYGREKVRPMNEHVFVNTSGTAIGHMNVDQRRICITDHRTARKALF